jgi:serine/threonine-protein kinase RsbW/stage II sporulation protein AB (anti-sigma F factor)
MDGPGVHTARRFCARADSVREARRAAVAFAREHDVPADKLDLVGLAVSEATTNVVVHAYRDRDEPGTFTLGLDIESGSLMIDVFDDGLGPVPRTDSPGLGLGLPIIAEVTDAHSFVPTNGRGAWLSMRFDIFR